MINTQLIREGFNQISQALQTPQQTNIQGTPQNANGNTGIDGPTITDTAFFSPELTNLFPMGQTQQPTFNNPFANMGNNMTPALGTNNGMGTVPGMMPSLQNAGTSNINKQQIMQMLQGMLKMLTGIVQQMGGKVGATQTQSQNQNVQNNTSQASPVNLPAPSSAPNDTIGSSSFGDLGMTNSFEDPNTANNLGEPKDANKAENAKEGGEGKQKLLTLIDDIRTSLPPGILGGMSNDGIYTYKDQDGVTYRLKKQPPEDYTKGALGGFGGKQQILLTEKEIRELSADVAQHPPM